MFWVHDKFGNMLDNPDGPGWPNYPTGLVRHDDPPELDRLGNPDRLGRPDDLKAWRPILDDCAVKFVNMVQSSPSRSLAPCSRRVRRPERTGRSRRAWRPGRARRSRRSRIPERGWIPDHWARSDSLPHPSRWACLGLRVCPGCWARSGRRTHSGCWACPTNNNIFFMLKMKAHGLALTHRAFVGFLTLWAFLMGAFFNVGFFGPSPHGSGPSPVGWAKLTPLGPARPIWVVIPVWQLHHRV